MAYPDFAPYLLITDASLKDLNKKLDKSVEMRRFRPNITVEGCTIPFSEVSEICTLLDTKVQIETSFGL